MYKPVTQVIYGENGIIFALELKFKALLKCLVIE